MSIGSDIAKEKKFSQDNNNRMHPLATLTILKDLPYF